MFIMTIDYNVLFIQFKCCGITTYNDWYAFLNQNSSELPLSCCDTAGITTNFSCVPKHNDTKFFDVGCVQAFGDEIQQHAVTIGGVAIGIAFIQVYHTRKHIYRLYFIC